MPPNNINLTEEERVFAGRLKHYQRLMQAGRGCEPSEVDVQPRPDTIFDVSLTKLVDENIPDAKEEEKP